MTVTNVYSGVEFQCFIALVPEPEEPEFMRKMRNLRRVARQEESAKTTEDDSAATSPSPYPRPKKHVAFHQSDGQKSTQPMPVCICCFLTYTTLALSLGRLF